MRTCDRYRRGPCVAALLLVIVAMVIGGVAGCTTKHCVASMIGPTIAVTPPDPHPGEVIIVTGRGFLYSTGGCVGDRPRLKPISSIKLQLRRAEGGSTIASLPPFAAAPDGTFRRSLTLTPEIRLGTYLLTTDQGDQLAFTVTAR